MDVPQVKKKQYRNNTSGWIGVVTLDHLGQEVGVSIEPKSTIWLSDAEALLTARAPSLPEHNPFVEREFRTIDPLTGSAVHEKVRPVTLVSDEERDIYGTDRYVPGITSDAEARAQAERGARDGSAATVTPALLAREQEVTRDIRDESRALPGTLHGSDEPAPGSSPPSSLPSPTPPQQVPAPAPVLAEEETASVPEETVPEETGSLTGGHAEVEGEYAQAEEVGTDQLGEESDDTEGLIG